MMVSLRPGGKPVSGVTAARRASSFRAAVRVLGPVDERRVAVGAGDGQAEQVAQGAEVTAGGLSFVEDPAWPGEDSQDDLLPWPASYTG